MDKKEFTVTILVIGLSILFTVVSLALFISRGKSKFWTAKKMKLGALLLTVSALTSMSSCKGGDEDNIRVSCYEMVERTNVVYIENFHETVNLKETKVLNGIIEYRSSEIYSYSLKNDSDSTFLSRELLIPKDGSFDDTTEQFSIHLNNDLVPGSYTLSFYDTGRDSTSRSIADYHFNIKNN